MSSPKGPYKLVTVSDQPERAALIVNQALEILKDRYIIVHAGNAESPETAHAIFEKIIPDIVFTALMWTPEQSSQILAQAREINPKVKTLATPQGLQADEGSDAVVELLLEKVPKLIES